MQALWMLFATLMFSLMSVFVKLASTEVSLPQVILFRGVPTAVGVLAWALATKRIIIPTAWRAHVLRNIAGIASLWLSFFAMGRLPLATAITLNYTSPLFIAGWMLTQRGHSRIDKMRLGAVILGFIGVLGILRPTFDQSQWLASLLGLIAGCMTAIAVMQVRTLGRAGEPEWRIVLFFSFSACLVGGIPTLFTGWTAPSAYGWFILLGVGISGMLGQFAMTRAFSRGSAALSAALQYSAIPFSILLGFIFWSDIPDAMAWLGMALIAAAGLLSTWRTMALAKAGK